MYAKQYEDNGDLESARQIYRKATKQPFRSVEDLASVWCQFAEMELRHGNYQQALAVLQEVSCQKQTNQHTKQTKPYNNRPQ
jgi:pre-mRNA-splicing factor SYF1